MTNFKRKPKKGKVTMGQRQITIQHDYSEIELQSKSRQLANACTRRERIIEEKKQIMSEYKAKIDQLNAEINLCSQQVTNKYEMKTIDAELVLDYDKDQRLYIGPDKKIW